MIAVATFCQAPTSFSIIVFGIMALNWANIAVFPVILVTLILPIFVTPLFFKLIWRDTKSVEVVDLPRFTPTSSVMETLFGSAREGAQLVFLFILPAGVVIFAIIGALEHFGVWQPLSAGLSSFLGVVGIEPETGTMSIIASGTLAMANLSGSLADGNVILPRLVIGSFVLANSAFPLQVPFGQIPAVWAPNLDLTEAEVMKAAILGCFFRVAYAIACAWLLAPLVS
jgi:hypothetical protein